MRCLRLVDQKHRGIDYFGSIMRRNTGRHPDCNAAGTVCQQVREQPGHNLGLFILAVVSRFEVGCILVEPVHQLDCGLGQPRLGIPIGSRIIAVDIAEIALPIDQRIAKRKCLSEADHRVINRLVAMRMIFTDNVADDASAFLITLRRVEFQ